MPFAKIAGNRNPSAMSGLTDHYKTQTLTRDQDELARYYSRGGDGERNLMAIADLISNGEISFSEGVSHLVYDWDDVHPRPSKPEWDAAAEKLMVWQQDRWVWTGADPSEVWEQQRDQVQERIAARLDVVVDQLIEGKEPEVQLGVIRPDIHPLARAGLGLDDGELTTDRINALLSGHRADGEKIEGRRNSVERELPPDARTGERRLSTPIGAYDFAPTPDKSVSVAWGMSTGAEQAQIFTAHIEAAREAVAYIGTQIGQARIGNGGEDGREQGHVGWMEFTHHTSRRTTAIIDDETVRFDIDKSTAGDPNLHTHFLIPNAVFCESGRVGSLDTAALHGFIFEADAFYHARLADKLRNAGFSVDLDERTGAAILASVPRDVCKLYSKRTNIGEEIAKLHAKRQGLDWDGLTEDQRETRVKNAVQDRGQKEVGGKDDIANVPEWKRQAKEFGWELPTTFKAMERERSVEIEHDLRIRRAYEHALPYLEEKLEHQAVLKSWDVRVAALRGLIKHGAPGDLDDVAAVTKLMREEGVRQYGEMTPLRWGQEPGARHAIISTRLHHDQEQEFILLAKAAARDKTAALTPQAIDRAAERSGLDFASDHGKTQLQAIHRLGEGGRFGVVIGTAGAGKSAMLKVLTDAWGQEGRNVYGASLAWRQADAMVDGGIKQANVRAFSELIKDVGAERIKLGRADVVAVDELGQLGTRQGLELLRLQARDGFQVVALGDDRQCQSVEAGAIIGLSRRALGAEQIPEIATTTRQKTAREREIVGLFREGRTGEALEMKRSDGTAEMVPGGRDGVIQRSAKLYIERFQATGRAPSVAAPTHLDAHNVSDAIRAERRKIGLVGPDIRVVKATDKERQYNLALAAGDRVRLFQSTPMTFSNGRGGRIGRNGTTVEVVGVDDAGVRMKSLKNDRVGHVKWKDLRDRDTGLVLLARGDCVTIHSDQGRTAPEHILVLPGGSQTVSGGTAYSGSTRHTERSYLLVNEVAERAEIRNNRPVNDPRDITPDDKWANTARHFLPQQGKDMAISMSERVRSLREGTVRSLQAVLSPAEQRMWLGQNRSHAPELAQQHQIELTPTIKRVVEIARQIPQQAIELARERARYIGRGMGISR